MLLPFAVHLAFNGNCKKAFDYYQFCFGGELTVQTLGDTSFSKEMSRHMQEIVICATLQTAYFRLVGTDLTDEGRIVSGNNVSILIECESFIERVKLVDKLVGRNFCAMRNTNPFINVRDKYSINWILGVNHS